MEVNQAKLRKADAQSALIKEELGDLQFMRMSEQLGEGSDGVEDSPIAIEKAKISV